MATICGAAGDFATSFVNTLPWFAASRFLSGLSTDTMYYLMYILGKFVCFGLKLVTILGKCDVSGHFT